VLTSGDAAEGVRHESDIKYLTNHNPNGWLTIGLRNADASAATRRQQMTHDSRGWRHLTYLLVYVTNPSLFNGDVRHDVRGGPVCNPRVVPL